MVVDLHGTKPGSTQVNDASAFPQHEPNRRIGYTYALSLHKEQFVRAALQAEAEGYDAFFMAPSPTRASRRSGRSCDPRDRLLQSSLLFAAVARSPIGFVLFVEAAEDQLRRHHSLRPPGAARPGDLRRLRLRRGDAGLRGLDRSGRDFTRGGGARGRAGCQGPRPGEGTVNILLARAGVSDDRRRPVIDSLGVGAVYAEMRARFYRRTGLTHAQWGFYYTTPPQALVDGLRQQYFGNGQLSSR